MLAAEDCCLIKLGGSLLELPNLTARLAELTHAIQPCTPLLVVGGGTTCDIVRQWDSVRHFDPVAAHDLAVAAMHLNERLITTLWPRSRLIETEEQLQAAAADRRGGVMHAERWLLACGDEMRRRGFPIPMSWDFTSDSIAAWIAIALRIPRLILAKSTDLCSSQQEPVPSLLQATSAGLVDPCLGGLVNSMAAVDWVNLRTGPVVIQPWLRSGSPVTS